MSIAKEAMKERIRDWKIKYGEGVYALIFGGRGCEREVSVESARCALSVLWDRLPLIPIYIDAEGGFYAVSSAFDDQPPDLSLASVFAVSPVICCGVGCLDIGGELIPIRRALPLLHGDFGEDGRIQGLLDSLNIPFVGADTVCGAVSSDKAYTKAVAASIGIPVLPYRTLGEGESSGRARELAGELGYPVFIKPCRLGSSIGAYCADCEEELLPLIEKSREAAGRIMLEPMLRHKRELECAYLSVGDKRIITPPGEAVTGNRFYDFEAKYKSSLTRIFPRAEVPRELAERLRIYTDRLAEELCVRDIARFDYFLSEDGQLYFNEVNTMPGMTEGSLYPMMLDASGVDLPSLLTLLLRGG